MFNDAHLPDTDAWGAMTRDLRQSKESRNALSKENSYVPKIQSQRNVMRADSLLSQATQAAIGRDRIREGRVCPACFLSRSPCAVMSRCF
jgi:hypothetical protein